ncbi:hypothetical protein R1sor_008637 [Riccia sorocarpa]|uniref:Uncharacterized protein n=1 Tax=Riccia sorocarpa TaxID=122646 RepID=A0ABD3HW32_9MARC
MAEEIEPEETQTEPRAQDAAGLGLELEAKEDEDPQQLARIPPGKSLEKPVLSSEAEYLSANEVEKTSIESSDHQQGNRNQAERPGIDLAAATEDLIQQTELMRERAQNIYSQEPQAPEDVEQNEVLKPSLEVPAHTPAVTPSIPLGAKWCDVEEERSDEQRTEETLAYTSSGERLSRPNEITLAEEVAGAERAEVNKGESGQDEREHEREQEDESDTSPSIIHKGHDQARSGNTVSSVVFRASREEATSFAIGDSQNKEARWRRLNGGRPRQQRDSLPLMTRWRMTGRGTRGQKVEETVIKEMPTWGTYLIVKKKTNHLTLLEWRRILKELGASWLAERWEHQVSSRQGELAPPTEVEGVTSLISSPPELREIGFAEDAPGEGSMED